MNATDIGPLHLLGLSAFAGLMVVLAVWGYAMRSAKTAASVVVDTPTAKEDEDETFILHRITERIGGLFIRSVLESLGEDHRTNINRRIEAAGRPDNLNVERYVRRKIGEVLLYGTGSIALILNGSAMFGISILAFAVLTDADLFMKSRQRQDDIQKQLPDFLDVLAVTVGAGLSFRQALERTADSMPGTLSDEIKLVMQQMDVGTPRRVAFDKLRKRNTNEALGQFVTALQQSEELGAPLANALMEISNDVRNADFQYLRQKAQKLNPQVTGITAATMLPATLVLIIGGLVLSMDFDSLPF